jgi:hypothetical protein
MSEESTPERAVDQDAAGSRFDDPAGAVQFPIALRGYDRIAVDAYVKKTSQRLTQLDASRSPEAAVKQAIARVGDEVAGILQRAHETAAQVTADSQREADSKLETARDEAARIVADARVRLKDLDAETDRIWAERHRIVEDTRELARQLLELADSAIARFPAAEEGEGAAQAAAAGAGGELGSPAIYDAGAAEAIEQGGGGETSAERDAEMAESEDATTAVFPPLWARKDDRSREDDQSSEDDRSSEDDWPT